MRNVVDGFAAVAARHADRTAVTCGARRLSYRELDGEAARLASAIQAAWSTGTAGTGGRQRPVAILLPRSVDLAVAALAVLRTGACYLPLDPVSPPARLGAILADAAPSLVLTSRALAGLLPDGVPSLLVDDLQPAQGGGEPALIEPDTPAYVIFTSGTTGRPKGVQVSHANLLRLFTTTEPLFRFDCADVWTLFHSFAFDFSVWEMWGALLYGGRLVVVSEEAAKDPSAFRQLLNAERVTVLNQTPTAFVQLAAVDTRCADRLPLKHVVFGGERLHFADLRPWVAKYGDNSPELVNMYGITETTVHASYRRVLREDLDDSRCLIGHPLPDLDFELVDGNLHPVDEGQVGEIVITGSGVSLGYLARPELTRERFVKLRNRHGRRVRGYCSGDLAAHTPTGEYEYRGRNDEQVKIRGFRIELGEIQSALRNAPGVAQAAVLAREPRTPTSPVVKQRAVPTGIATVRDLVRGGQPNQPRRDRSPQLVGYVVAGEGFEPARFFAHLRSQLPPYMLPAFVVRVDAIPVNRNGKADLTALPPPSAANRLIEPVPAQPDTVGHEGAGEDAGKGAGEDVGEDVGEGAGEGAGEDADVRELRTLFEEVLGVDGVGADDSFFSVGGDSILALNLRAAGLARGIDLDLADVYSLHTPRALAKNRIPGTATGSAAVAPFDLIHPHDRAALPPDVQDAYPIGTLQAGLLFHSAYQDDTSVYCDTFMFRLALGYNHHAMAQALARAVARHDVLRTSFHFAGFSEPLQLVHASAHPPLTTIDLRGLDPAAQEVELEAWRARERGTGYDFRHPPLLRFTVHLLGDEQFQLAMSFHDALLDGWSESSLITEILTDYTALKRGEHRPPAPRPARRYADFIALERAALHSESIQRFWSEELADAVPTLLSRPGEAGNPRRIAGATMGFLSVDIEPELSEALDELARVQGLSPKHVLLAVHARVLSTLTGQTSVLVGVESNGRVEDSGGAEVIGTHLNVVPYLLSTRNRTWRELIYAASAKESKLFAARRFPYAELQRRIGVPELTDASFNYTHFHSYRPLAGSELAVLDAKAYIQTHFTLRVEFNRDPFTALLTLDLEADLDRLPAERLRRIGELYRRALAGAGADRHAIPTQCALLGEREWQAMLAKCRSTPTPLPAEGFFPIFGRSAEYYGDSPAACCGDVTVSYAALIRRVTALARRLRRAGVGPGGTVALAAERGVDFLTAVLAIMRTGAVYLPLPTGPAARVAGMLTRSGATVVLSDHTARAMLAEAASAGTTIIDLASALTEIRHDATDPAANESEPPIGPGPSGADLAYLIFTSGSTGQPKGALIRHDGMLNHLQAKIAALELGPGDRVSQDAAATFDISVWQMLAPLMVGATTVIYPDPISQDPPRLLRATGPDAVTVLEVSPSVLSVLTGELAHYGVDAFPELALRWVLCSGEILTPKAAGTLRRLLPEVRMLNMWGATEVSDDCTHYELPAVSPSDGDPAGSVPIGWPIDNTAVYVLDNNTELVPPGVPGELCVGGLCVGAGYVRDPERTAYAFVPDPFACEPGAMMYRTGDQGWRGVDGRLEFLGRLDRQVKVRGHRLEIGEVERALAGLPELRESAVVARSSEGGTQLAAFFVPSVLAHHPPQPDPDHAVRRLDLTSDALRASLERVLPRYAVPDLLIPLDALPRTPHGKVDTTALAGWDLSGLGGQPVEDRPTVTATESAVIDVWQAVLGREHLGPGTHFFEIGGHSLHATQVMARLQDRLGRDLPLRMLFEHPKVRELAARIDGLAGEPEQQGTHSAIRIPRRPAGTSEVPLALNQAGLWFLDQLDSADRAYQNTTLLRISGSLDVEALRFAVDTVAGRHEILFTRFGSRHGVPYQVVIPTTRIRLECETVPDGARLAVTPERMTGYVRERLGRERFDLERGPLVIARLYRFTPVEHVLDWSSHHIISDGWSTNVIVAEIREAYLAHLEHRPPRLSDLPVQYGDYALWQQHFLGSAEGAREIAFWRDYLDGYPGELELPADVAPTTNQASRPAGYVTKAWDPALQSRIAAFTERRNTTPFLLFHAVTSVIIAKLAQQSDVVLAAAVAGRDIPDTEQLVGFFAHVLPLRYQVDLAGTPEQLLRSVTNAALIALEHQHIPVQEISKAIGAGSTTVAGSTTAQRRLGRSALMQMLVTVDNYPLDLTTGLPGLTVHIEHTSTGDSVADLMFGFVEGPEPRLTVQYDASLFTAGTAHRLLDACDRLLDFSLRHPDRPLASAMLLADEDRAALRRIWYDLTSADLDFGNGLADTLLNSAHWPALVDRVDAQGLLPALLMAL